MRSTLQVENLHRRNFTLAFVGIVLTLLGGATAHAGRATRNVDQAIAWARGQKGTQNWATYTCLKFARTAYGYTSSYDTAKTAADTARRKGILRGGRPTDAPRGAFLFYNWGTAGHVGIRTDGSNLIHAWTTSGARYARIEEVNANLSLSFVGWVAPGDLNTLMP